MEDWIKSCENYISNLPCSRRMRVENLDLIVSASEQDLVDWVADYLYPLVRMAESEKSGQPFRLNCIYATAIVSAAIKDIERYSEHVRVVKGNESRPVYLWDDNDSGYRILVCAIDGILWLCNEAERTITLVYSNRTHWPALELSRAARAVITQYLHSENWFLCHAGAVATASGNFMIVGKSGAGKTTLIFALLQSGAKYIANELLFAKPCDSGLRVLSYALPVAVGMGTALQFKSIAELLEKPYCLQYPPRRLRIEKLATKKRKSWLKQKGKLQILPSELPMVFPDATSIGSAVIDKVVVPKVNFDDIEAEANQLTTDAAMAVFSKNLLSISDEAFPVPWLKTGFIPPESRSNRELIKSVNKLPAVEFEYHVSLDGSKNDKGFSHFLDAINQSYK